MKPFRVFGVHCCVERSNRRAALQHDKQACFQ
jgi:hypothetical protein